jgi:hypothetical protein
MDEVYALHLKLTAGREIRAEEESGGYARDPDYYREVRNIDAGSGRLISMIQWEKAHPDRIHAIEVYIYDEQGRVTRDYSGWYAPHERKGPRSTWVTLYRYNGALRAWRQFDGLGPRLRENCQGTLDGKKVRIDLDPPDLVESEGEPQGVFATVAYRRCFETMPMSAGRYLKPQ